MLWVFKDEKEFSKREGSVNSVGKGVGQPRALGRAQGTACRPCRVAGWKEKGKAWLQRGVLGRGWKQMWVTPPPGAALTKRHTPGCLKQQKFIVSQFWRP